MGSFISVLTCVTSILTITNAFYLNATLSGSGVSEYVCTKSDRLSIGCEKPTKFYSDLEQIGVEGTRQLIFVSSTDGTAYTATWDNKPDDTQVFGFSFDIKGHYTFKKRKPVLDYDGFIHWSTDETKNMQSIIISRLD